MTEAPPVSIDVETTITDTADSLFELGLIQS